MHEPDYIVIRLAPDSPAGFAPDSLDGRWYDRANMPVAIGVDQRMIALARYGGGVAVATGRFETREYDWAVAEVYELRL